VPLKQMVLKTPSPESHCAGIKAGDERPAVVSFREPSRWRHSQRHHQLEGTLQLMRY
jgi:hypothetical protein